MGGPNDIWTTDFKGEFRLGNGEYCYPLTICDEYSRKILSCKGLTSTGYKGVFAEYRRVFDEYGLPRAIKSDNEWDPVCRHWFGKTLEAIGVVDQAGDQSDSDRAIESLPERQARAHASNVEAGVYDPAWAIQQRHFNAWRKEYNEVRPHETLGGRCPAELYRPSLRRMPLRLPPVEYPAHYEVRRVSATIAFRWHHCYVNASGSLVGEYVGLEEVLDGVWAVYFSWKRIGFMDERKGRILDHLGRYYRMKL